MRGAVLYGPGDVRFEQRADPKIVEPTDAIIRLSASCICGSDLWPYRGIQPLTQPTAMGHEYCDIVEEVGTAVRSVKKGQFVIGSFFFSETPARTAAMATSRRASTARTCSARRRRCSASGLRMARWSARRSVRPRT